jgi:hypothetical protein
MTVYFRCFLSQIRYGWVFLNFSVGLLGSVSSGGNMGNILNIVRCINKGPSPLSYGGRSYFYLDMLYYII